MIAKDEIDQKALEFGINPADIEKDYVYGWILNAINAHSSLNSLLILKGGNGLRKVYLPNTRFSKDLDFSTEQQIDIPFLHDELNKICSIVNEQTNVRFEMDRTLVRPKDVPIPNSDILEARLYFKGFYGEETISLKTQVDITQFDKIYLPIQSKELIHPYSDKKKCVVVIRCQKAEEILASKLNSLLHRQKVSDLFDLLYSILFTKDFSMNRLEVINTFLKKSIYESEPSSAKQLLLGIQLETYRPFWSTLIAPITSIFQFDLVAANFNQLIDALFSLLPIAEAPIPAFAPAYGMPQTHYGGGYGSFYSSPSYFSSDNRGVIISAGKSQKMVELTYDGYERLIEPYSMEYYVRKKDGVGSEYFWGYDNTGGKSGKQSIKMFFCNKIQDVRPTNYSFVPRYPIEF